ncbi:MAG: hypothetical protein A3G81_21080 [Betaproteobacteria bacterium RIFCSPLOWO2_12_FULL_65_14]|nr:MAG: hypothetical protein A3G81_21080 [Betaproteobacteria bacterium RIFCSPLOWO2_12_FULL_65_14]
MPAASQCQISTLALVTGAQAALTLTTDTASVRSSPVRSSRTSLRTGSVIEGKGPAVSDGVTVVVAVVVAVVGLRQLNPGQCLIQTPPNPAITSCTSHDRIFSLMNWL